MSTQTTTPEAPEVEPEATPRIERVEDLPDDLRRDIVARRENGETLSELKSRFAHVAPDVIREVLPPANTRERKARERQASRTQGHIDDYPEGPVPEAKSKRTIRNGRGATVRTAEDARRSTRTERQGEAAAQAERAGLPPVKSEEPRYATDLGDLGERVLAARDVVGGRNRLAELLGGISGSAVWRHERGRTHPTEVGYLREALARVEAKIAAGEFVKAAAEPKEKPLGRAELTHRIEVAVKLLGDARAATVSKTKNALIDQALDTLAPRPPESGSAPA